MQYFSVDDGFSVQFNNIIDFVDLHPWTGRDF